MAAASPKHRALFFAAEPCIKQLADFLTQESKMKKEMIQTAVIGLIAILAFSAGAVDKPISASPKDKDLKWGPCPAFFPTKCDVNINSKACTNLKRCG